MDEGRKLCLRRNLTIVFKITWRRFRYLNCIEILLLDLDDDALCGRSGSVR